MTTRQLDPKMPWTLGPCYDPLRLAHRIALRRRRRTHQGSGANRGSTTFELDSKEQALFHCKDL